MGTTKTNIMLYGLGTNYTPYQQKTPSKWRALLRDQVNQNPKTTINNKTTVNCDKEIRNGENKRVQIYMRNWQHQQL